MAVPAFFTTPRIDAKAIVQTTAIQMTLTPEQADALYNDIYRITNDAGISNVHQRGDHFPTLFALYDALDSVGVDGAGSVSA